MATLFSNHYGTGQANTSVSTGYKASAGINHARARIKQARITVPIGGTGGTANDVWRLMTFKSSDRIFSLLVTVTGTGGAGAAHLGLYKAGANHDGAVIDTDLFASALSLINAIARVDQFKEAATLEDEDRGKTLWELADEGAGTYTSDPMEEWDLTAEISTTTTTAATEVLVEVLYTSGD